jgi:hypothetical protein
MADNKNFFAHPTAVIDEGCVIGEGTKFGPNDARPSIELAHEIRPKK